MMITFIILGIYISFSIFLLNYSICNLLKWIKGTTVIAQIVGVEAAPKNVGCYGSYIFKFMINGNQLIVAEPLRIYFNLFVVLFPNSRIGKFTEIKFDLKTNKIVMPPSNILFNLIFAIFMSSLSYLLFLLIQVML